MQNIHPKRSKVNMQKEKQAKVQKLKRFAESIDVFHVLRYDNQPMPQVSSTAHNGVVKMLKIERHNLIDQEIRKAGFVLVPDLSEKLQCSEETVRRDLKEMEKAGKLVRTHGGAYLVEKYDKGYPIELRRSYLQHTKEKLAEAAVKEIRENDVVMLDASTTCLAIAEAILARELHITLVTNSLAICNLFSGANSSVNLIGVGGTFRSRTLSFADPTTVEALRRYYADCAFVSCPKVNVEFGLSDNHISEANVRRQMLCNAQKKVLVVDHTKLEGNANILFDGLEKIGLIITDQRLPEAFEAYAAQREIEVRICQE